MKLNKQPLLAPIGLLIAILLAGCEQTSHTSTIMIYPTYRGKAIDCNSKFAAKQSWRLNQLKLYISDPTIIVNQQVYKVSFDTQENESSNVQLLGGVCGASFNWEFSIASPVNPTQISAFEFSLGVPFELNHNNPLVAKQPLNQSDMFWTWQTGYKFLRLELDSNNADWVFHLGSMGCQSPSPVRAPANPCEYPNLSRIRLNQFDASKPISFDLANLLENIELANNTSCQSSPSNPSCQTLLPRLGINGDQNTFKQN